MKRWSLQLENIIFNISKYAVHNLRFDKYMSLLQLYFLPFKIDTVLLVVTVLCRRYNSEILKKTFWSNLVITISLTLFILKIQHSLAISKKCKYSRGTQIFFSLY